MEGIKWSCFILFVVSLEIHRLATENSHLGQLKEESKTNMDKLAQKAANLVRTLIYVLALMK